MAFCHRSCLRKQSEPSRKSVNEHGTLAGHYRYWTLPFFRYTSLLKLLLFCSMVTALTLWICGGNSDYFVNSVVNYTFCSSSFDVAVIAALKCLSLWLLCDATEKAALDANSEFRQEKHNLAASRRNVLLATMIGFSGACLTFNAVKVGLVLCDAICHSTGQFAVAQSSTIFNATIIAASVMAFVEFLLACGLAQWQKNIRKMATLHFENEFGEEVDEFGQPLVKTESLSKQLFALISPEAVALVMALLTLTASCACNVAIPIFCARIIDAVVKGEYFDRSLLVVLLLQCGNAIGTFFRAYFFGIAGQRIAARIRQDLLDNLLRQEVAFFDMTKTGELNSRLSADTQIIENALSFSLPNLLRNLLIVLSSIGVMFALSARVGGVMAGVVPLVSVASHIYGIYVKKVKDSYQKVISEAGHVSEQSISNIKTVRALSAEERTSHIFEQHMKKTRLMGSRLSLADGVYQFFVALIASGTTALCIWYGGMLARKGEMTTGVFAALIAYTSVLTQAFSLVMSSITELFQAVGASSKVLDLMRRQPLIRPEGGIVPYCFIPSIEFKEVTFAYPTRPEVPVLKDVTLRATPGATLALVGPSGGGKSTIVNLIERFYDPNQGKIFIGTHSLQDLDMNWLRKRVALVSQEPSLFACSIRENIAYGCQDELSDDQIMEAAKQANAHDFIMSFPDGYNTVIGERGAQLSGGQKQRIAIARALICNPLIMLLDEATSALDAESERLVQEAIDRAMVGRTAIVIAHRLSTVKNASQVVVIDNGVVVEMGTHAELCRQGGIYSQLVSLQLTHKDPDKLFH